MARGTTPAPSPAAHDQPDTATSTTTSHTAPEAAPTPATPPRYASATTTPNTTPASRSRANQTARVSGPAPPVTAIGYRLQTAKRYAGSGRRIASSATATAIAAWIPTTTVNACRM